MINLNKSHLIFFNKYCWNTFFVDDTMPVLPFLQEVEYGIDNLPEVYLEDKYNECPKWDTKEGERLSRSKIIQSIMFGEGKAFDE